MRFSGGLPETPCGFGSTLQATEDLRRELPGLLARLRTKVLLDAPCGDRNWIADMDLGSIDYVGVDLSEANLAIARERSPHAALGTLDIVHGRPPVADTVLCRDFLQHLPTAMAQRALGNLSRSGARWLLATSHDNPVNEDIETVGDFRPLNLMIEPFNLGEPVESVDDGPGRILGVWDLAYPRVSG